MPGTPQCTPASEEFCLAPLRGFSAETQLTRTENACTLSSMLNSASLKNYLETQMPAALEMLRQMVGINSYTANRAGVNRLSRLTAECFAPLGFTAEFVPSANRAW